MFADPYVREFFLTLSDAWYNWPDNTEEMYRSDIAYWTLNVMDGKLTGEHNAAVERVRNPKAKPKSGKNIESFAQNLAPVRWQTAIQKAKKIRAEMKAAHKDQEIDIAEGMIRKLQATAKRGEA